MSFGKTRKVTGLEAIAAGRRLRSCRARYAGGTIFALASGAAPSAVAVFRISGSAARLCLERLAGALPKARTATLRTLHAQDGVPLDRGLILWMPAPASFTGEDMAEIHVHGGSAVLRRCGEALAAIDGVRFAEAGEFTRRAFVNGKLDMLQVEALADLVAARSEVQRVQALRQLRGVLGREASALRRDLVRACAMAEAAIDFSDEDLPCGMEGEVRSLLASLDARLSALLGRRGGEVVRHGLRVTLAGRPNAGKSTLFNRLLGRDAAIVHDEAGTTRDILEAAFEIGGLSVVLADTAGLRHGGDAVEREGVRRAFLRLRESDLVLWMVSSDTGLPGDDWPAMGEGARVQVVLGKCDRDDAVAFRSEVTAWCRARGLALPLAVSVRVEGGVNAVMEFLRREAGGVAGGGEAVLTRVRHRLCVSSCRRHVRHGLRCGAFELRAEALRCAVGDMGRLTGAVDVEEVLDAVFSEFCIGK